MALYTTHHTFLLPKMALCADKIEEDYMVTPHNWSTIGKHWDWRRDNILKHLKQSPWTLNFFLKLFQWSSHKGSSLKKKNIAKRKQHNTVSKKTWTLSMGKKLAMTSTFHTILQFFQNKKLPYFKICTSPSMNDKLVFDAVNVFTFKSEHCWQLQ